MWTMVAVLTRHCLHLASPAASSMPTVLLQQVPAASATLANTPTCRHSCQPAKPAPAWAVVVFFQLACSSTFMSASERQDCLAPAHQYCVCGQCLPWDDWRWRPAGLQQLHGMSLAVCGASQPCAFRPVLLFSWQPRSCSC